MSNTIALDKDNLWEKALRLSVHLQNVLALSQKRQDAALRIRIETLCSELPAIIAQTITAETSAEQEKHYIAALSRSRELDTLLNTLYTACSSNMEDNTLQQELFSTFLCADQLREMILLARTELAQLLAS